MLNDNDAVVDAVKELLKNGVPIVFADKIKLRSNPGFTVKHKARTTTTSTSQIPENFTRKETVTSENASDALFETRQVGADAESAHQDESPKFPGETEGWRELGDKQRVQQPVLQVREGGDIDAPIRPCHRGGSK